MKTTFLRKTASVLASASMLLATLAPLMLPSTAHAGPSIYTIAGSSSLTGTILTLSGFATSTNMTGTDDGQHMAVDWDLDKNASTTDWIVYPDAGGLTTFFPIFSGTGGNRGFTATWNGSHDYSSLGGGTYTVRVMVYHGSTTGHDGSASLDTLVFTIVIPPSTGGITVTKTTTGGDGTFNFTGTGSIGAFTITTSGGTGTKDLYNLATSTPYTITETVQTGWDQTSNTCSNVSVAAGATSTCAIANTKRGSVTVVKDVVAPDGETDVSDNHGFKVTLDDGTQQNFSENTSYTFENVLPGPHTIAEIGDPDFDLLRISGDDDDDASNGAPVVVTAGQNTTVTITNAQRQGSLIVKKVVTNPNGGTAVAGDFSFMLNGGNPIQFIQDLLNALLGENGLSVDPGSYTITEVPEGAYAISYDNCEVTVASNGQSGGLTTCTITNSDIPDGQGAITVVKNVTNDNGGDLTAENFTLFITPEEDGPYEVSNGQANFLVPDVYTVSESQQDGYQQTSISCTDGETTTDGTVELGEQQSWTCTITNDDIAPRLHLRKIVDTENGGEATVADFTLTADGTGSNDLSGTSPVDSGAGLLADTWTLSETPLAGYVASDWVCVGGTQDGNSITLGLGEEATCTITNTFVPTPLDVTPPASVFDDGRDHQIIDTELVQLSLSGTSTDAVGPQEDPRSGVVSASMSLYRLADAQTMDGEGFFDSGFPGLTCSNLEQVPIEIIALSLTSVEPLTVRWDPVHQSENPLTSLERGVYCAVVNATDNAGNIEHTTIAGPFAYTFTPPPPPPPVSKPQCSDGIDNDGDGRVDYPSDNSCSDSGDTTEGNDGGGWFGGGAGQVLGASVSVGQASVSTGQVLGVSCGLYMDQHLRKGSAKNKPDQVTKLQQFLNKGGFGKFAPTGTFGPLTEAAAKAFQSKYADEILKPWSLSGPTGLVYLTTIRQLNLLECPELMLPLPALVPWNQNPNAQ